LTIQFGLGRSDVSPPTGGQVVEGIGGGAPGGDAAFVEKRSFEVSDLFGESGLLAIEAGRLVRVWSAQAGAVGGGDLLSEVVLFLANLGESLDGRFVPVADRGQRFGEAVESFLGLTHEFGGGVGVSVLEGGDGLPSLADGVDLFAAGGTALARDRHLFHCAKEPALFSEQVGTIGIGSSTVECATSEIGL
jgi:hypothetical protein